MKFVIVTGISGAGKTTALKALENIGFFCVDNLPSILLTKFADLCFQGNTEFSKVAVGIDVRGREFFGQLEQAIDYMDKNNYMVDILFLSCDRDVLVNRYNFTRHVHPLAQEGTILECIEKEEQILAPIKKHATFMLDTSKMLPKHIKLALERLYKENKSDTVKVYITSFGFKRGIPTDADFIFDARYLPNPYNITELRPHSGLESCVLQYLKGSEDFNRTVDMIYDSLKYMVPLYHNSGKQEMLYAIGCTGGFHRSVALAEAVAERLKADGFDIICEHRDLSAEGGQEKWKNHSQQ